MPLRHSIVRLALALRHPLWGLHAEGTNGLIQADGLLSDLTISQKTKQKPGPAQAQRGTSGDGSVPAFAA